MKKLICAMVASLALSFSISTPAYAGSLTSFLCSFPLFERFQFCAKKPSTPPPVAAVPEIDAASGAQAIALVAGVLLLGAERLRRRG